MQDIFQALALSTLTATPAWKEDCLAAWPTDKTFVPTAAEVVQNMHMLPQLLQVSALTWGCVVQCLLLTDTFAQAQC